METIGKAVRYPDGVVTCSKVKNEARLIPDVVIVFEVVRPTSGRIDRIVKVREYGAVPSIRRYVIVESSSVDLTVMARMSRIALFDGSLTVVFDGLPTSVSRVL